MGKFLSDENIFFMREKLLERNWPPKIPKSAARGKVNQIARKLFKLTSNMIQVLCTICIRNFCMGIYFSCDIVSYLVIHIKNHWYIRYFIPKQRCCNIKAKWPINYSLHPHTTYMLVYIHDRFRSYDYRYQMVVSYKQVDDGCTQYMVSHPRLARNHNS